MGGVSFLGNLATGPFLAKFFSRNTLQVILDLMIPVLCLNHVGGGGAKKGRSDRQTHTKILSIIYIDSNYRNGIIVIVHLK